MQRMLRANYSADLGIFRRPDLDIAEELVGSHCLNAVDTYAWSSLLDERVGKMKRRFFAFYCITPAFPCKDWSCFPQSYASISRCIAW